MDTPRCVLVVVTLLLAGWAQVAFIFPALLVFCTGQMVQTPKGISKGVYAATMIVLGALLALVGILKVLVID